jgi:hypothetical protein
MARATSRHVRKVVDELEVPEQFRDPAPKRGPGRLLSYTPEVANELCERLEAVEPIKQICRDALMPDWKTLRRRRRSARSRVGCRRTSGGLTSPHACARLPTSRQIVYLTERSTVARRVILCVPRTRPGRQPKADRFPVSPNCRALKSVSGTAAALSHVTEALVDGSDAQRTAAAERMRRCRARRAVSALRHRERQADSHVVVGRRLAGAAQPETLRRRTRKFAVAEFLQTV